MLFDPTAVVAARTLPENSGRHDPKTGGRIEIHGLARRDRGRVSGADLVVPGGVRVETRRVRSEEVGRERVHRGALAARD